MASSFTDYERWALSQPIPRLRLAALENPSELELHLRLLAVTHSLCSVAFGPGEKGLTNMLLQLGALETEELCQDPKQEK